MKKRLALFLILLLLPLPAGAEEMDAQAVVEHVIAARGQYSFEGLRRLEIFRSDSKNGLVAHADVRYANANNFLIAIKDPITIGGVQFTVANGVVSAYFPDEKLFLSNGERITADMPERIIMGRITENPVLLQKNYSAALLKEDFVALTPTYVLDFQPLAGLDKIPGRRYWISHKTFQILREERYWTPGTSYYTNQYEIFKADTQPVISALSPPSGINQVNLSGKDKNSFFTYSTIAEAEQKEHITAYPPSYLPPGFQLKNLQVFTLFGARIQVFNYSDGLNDLLVTIRPQQNFFVTFLAGAMSLNLIKKISDLSFHAPNNYVSRTGPNHIAVAFGDAMQAELNQVAASIPLPDK